MRKNNDIDMMQTSSFNLKNYLQFNAITLENWGLVYLLLVDVN